MVFILAATTGLAMASPGQSITPPTIAVASPITTVSSPPSNAIAHTGFRLPSATSDLLPSSQVLACGALHYFSFGKDCANTLRTASPTPFYEHTPRGRETNVQSLETTLRKKNSLCSNPDFEASLGFTEKIPSIPRHLAQNCYELGGSLVLDCRSNLSKLVLDIKQAMRRSENYDLHCYRVELIDPLGLAAFVENKPSVPSWVILPNTIDDGSCGLSVLEASIFTGNHQLYHVNSILRMLAAELLKTGEIPAGFAGRCSYAADVKAVIPGTAFANGGPTTIRYISVGCDGSGLRIEICPEEPRPNPGLGQMSFDLPNFNRLDLETKF